jgi:hypothetical protein
VRNATRFAKSGAEVNMGKLERTLLGVARPQQIFVVVVVILLMGLLLLLPGEVDGQLSVNFYQNTACGNLEAVIQTVMVAKFQQASTSPAAILRLFFHDCMVNVSAAARIPCRAAAPSIYISFDAVQIIQLQNLQ